MADVIDDLRVQLDVSAQNADAKIDRFIQKMSQLQSVISGLEMSGVSQVASGLNQLSHSVQSFSQNTKTADFSRIVNGMNRLAAIDVQGVSNAARAMSTLSSSLASIGTLQYDGQGILNLANSIAQLGRKTVTQATQNIPALRSSLASFIQTMNGLQSVSFDSSGLISIVNSITRLGGKAATSAIPNIQSLAVALNNMMVTLSKAPAVSQNLIQMTNAMANLASNGQRVSSASRSLATGINMYSSSARRATKSTRSLVSQIGMFYARCFLLIRGVRALWRATKSAMDYVETLNYFNVAWGQVGDIAAANWSEAGYKSAESYAKSFESRSKELTGKLTGFRPDENGNLVATGAQSLGMDPDKTMNYQATFGQMASSMGVASETALQLSNALTMIGADLASVRNMKFEDVWQDMSSGMVGMSRTLDKYGVNIRNVNLQQKLNDLGIQASVAALNQQDKALLRVIILLQSTKYAWGDLANTIYQPANQLRLLSANFANLARTIGNLLLPVVSKVLPYINALVIAVQRLFAWLGGLLGISIGGFSSSIGSAAAEMDDLEDAAGGVADDMGSAADNAKKMTGNLQSFDKLNVVNSQNDSGGGGGVGGTGGLADGLLDDAFLDAFAEYQAAWDDAFNNMENSAQEMADKIQNAFEHIWEAAEPTRDALKRLWDEGFAQFRDFAWTGVNDFYTNFLVPMGSWTLGTGLPMLIDNINAFLLKIDFPAINEALLNFWQALEPFAEKVGEGLIDFYGDMLSIGADFINLIVPGAINGLADSLSKIDPKLAETIGYAIGTVAAGFMGFKTVKSVIPVVQKIYAPLSKLFSLVGPMKYIAIAAGIGGLAIALNKFGLIKINWNAFSNGFENLAQALGKFIIGIGDGLVSFIKQITPLVSVTLQTAVNAVGAAFEFLAKVLNSIPTSVVSGLTVVLLNFFAIWKAVTFLNIMSGVITHLYNMRNAFMLLGKIEFDAIRNVISGFFTSLASHPYLLIVGGLLAVATHIMKVTDEASKNSSLGKFSQALSDLNNEVSSKTDQINSNLDKTRESVETAGVAESQMARDLASEYNNLSNKASLSADQKERLKDVSAELVDIVPALKGYFNEETGELNIQKDALDAVIQGYESLAQKQAAQEYLVEAYKNQYEAQMNVNNAVNSYNKAFDEYLTQAGLAPSVIKDIEDGQLDLNQAYIDFQNSPNAFKEKYGVNDVATLKKAVSGLSEEMSEYNVVLDDAKQAQAEAGENLSFLKNVIEESDAKIKEATENELAARMASDDYQQSIKDLNTAFGNLDLTLADDFLQKLALESLNGGFDPAVLDDFFASLAEGVQTSGDELKTAFENLGMELPTEIAKGLSNKEASVQLETTKLLMSIQSGVQANSGQLKTLFSDLGIELPESLLTNLSSREPNVQTQTISLLSKIENGFSLTKGGLITIFSGLGLDLPEELIASMASKDSSVQSQAIQLLGQISEAEESERKTLIDKFNELGVGIADDGIIKALSDKQSDATTATSEFVNEGIKKPLETEADGIKSTASDIGKNTVEGFNEGVDKNKGTTQGVIGRWVNNISSWFTNALGIHSPSKLFTEYGGFTVNGYNEGVEKNAKDSYNTMKSWSSGLVNAFGSPELNIPDTNYTVNRQILDSMEATAQVRFSSGQYDLRTSISDGLQAALSGIIDYDRLGDVLAEKLENANLVAELDADKAYSNVKDKWSKEFKRTNKAPVPI